MILDSGERREFVSGAVRDVQDGKGRCDLLPLVEIGEILNDDVLIHVGEFMRTRNTDCVASAIWTMVDQAYHSGADAALDVAKHFEDGAKKYDERNWEKGIPCHCYIDSGVRHYLKYLDGWTDEPHGRAFIWNMVCLLWTLRNRPECNDLPEVMK